MRSIVKFYLRVSMRLKRFLWGIMHRMIIRKYQGSEVVFLNYGYADIDSKQESLALEEQDEKERYCVQLYHNTVADVSLENKEVLEVGCGRGGGASYITRYMKPKKYIGLDLSKDVIKFCNNYHQIPNLSFVEGNAQKLPFEAKTFDAIVNVESSRSYNDFEKFVAEVYRVLKPKGHLLFADIRTEKENEHLKKQFTDAGFTIIQEENIIENIVKALEIDSARREKLIKEKAPRIMHGIAEEFSATKNSQRFKEFSKREMIYVRYVLQKA